MPSEKAHQPIKIHELENLFKLVSEKFIKDYKAALRLVYWHDNVNMYISLDIYDKIISRLKMLAAVSNDSGANFAFKKMIKALTDRRLYAANEKV